MRPSLARTVLTLLAAIVVATGLAAGALAVTGGGGSTVTRPRLERSLPVVFSNLYAQRASLLGHSGVTPTSLDAKALCDKHGPDVADEGPGGDWVCLMSWSDPDTPMPAEGYGKFELNVHSNDCYTASSPSKLTGFRTLTDTGGREVENPVFEFDGCFDPQANDAPTGTVFPSLLSVTSTALSLDTNRLASVQVNCGTGEDGCRGWLTGTAGHRDLGRVPFEVREEATATLTLPRALPEGADDAAFTFSSAAGVGPSGTVTLSAP